MASPGRTTMRMQASAFLRGLAAPSQPDTIYYLRTETPHLFDFSMFGPFHCLEAMVPSIRIKLRQESPASLNTFDEMMSTGPHALSSFEHIVAPLPGNHTMTIRVVKEKNAEVAASLPGPTWLVVCAELLSSPIGRHDGNEQPKLKDMSICGAFVSAQKANEAVHRVVAEKLGGNPRGRKFDLLQEDGMLACMAVLGSKTWLVEAKFESGVEISEE